MGPGCRGQYIPWSHPPSPAPGAGLASPALAQRRCSRLGFCTGIGDGQGAAAVTGLPALGGRRNGERGGGDRRRQRIARRGPRLARRLGGRKGEAGVGVVHREVALGQARVLHQIGLGLRPPALADVLVVGRDCNGGEDRHDRNRDHQLDQGETACLALHGHFRGCGPGSVIGIHRTCLQDWRPQGRGRYIGGAPATCTTIEQRAAIAASMSACEAPASSGATRGVVITATSLTGAEPPVASSTAPVVDPGWLPVGLPMRTLVSAAAPLSAFSPYSQLAPLTAQLSVLLLSDGS